MKNFISSLEPFQILLLEAYKFVGISIHKFCYHETLSIAGNCRMCLVKLEGLEKPVASCFNKRSTLKIIKIIHSLSPLISLSHEQLVWFELIYFKFIISLIFIGLISSIFIQIVILLKNKWYFYCNKKYSFILKKQMNVETQPLIYVYTSLYENVCFFCKKRNLTFQESIIIYQVIVKIFHKKGTIKFEDPKLELKLMRHIDEILKNSLKKGINNCSCSNIKGNYSYFSFTYRRNCGIFYEPINLRYENRLPIVVRSIDSGRFISWVLSQTLKETNKKDKK